MAPRGQSPKMSKQTGGRKQNAPQRSFGRESVAAHARRTLRRKRLCALDGMNRERLRQAVSRLLNGGCPHQCGVVMRKGRMRRKKRAPQGRTPCGRTGYGENVMWLSADFEQRLSVFGAAAPGGDLAVVGHLDADAVLRQGHGGSLSGAA